MPRAIPHSLFEGDIPLDVRGRAGLPTGTGPGGVLTGGTTGCARPDVVCRGQPGAPGRMLSAGEQPGALDWMPSVGEQPHMPGPYGVLPEMKSGTAGCHAAEQLPVRSRADRSAGE